MKSWWFNQPLFQQLRGYESWDIASWIIKPTTGSILIITTGWGLVTADIWHNKTTITHLDHINLSPTISPSGVNAYGAGAGVKRLHGGLHRWASFGRDREDYQRFCISQSKSVFHTEK